MPSAPDEALAALTPVEHDVDGDVGLFVEYGHDAGPVEECVAGPGLEELFLARAERIDIDGTLVPVARAEDIITMKILAGRPKDLDDVHAILKARGRTLDIGLTRSTLELLEQALDQSDLVPVLDRALSRAGLANR